MSYWYCPNCKIELDGCHVTYEELCEYCGTKVLSVPETITQEELDAIIQAKAEGRLVELPPDGQIYHIEEIKETGERWIGNKPCQYIQRDGYYCGWGLAAICFPFSDIGKTAFLTREEAEKAIGGFTMNSKGKLLHDEIQEQVKANHAKLDSCSYHDFSKDITPDQTFCKKYQCVNCGGTVDSIAKNWYEKGGTAMNADEKLRELIDIVEMLVCVSSGIRADHANSLLERLYDLKETTYER